MIIDVTCPPYSIALSISQDLVIYSLEARFNSVLPVCISGQCTPKVGIQSKLELLQFGGLNQSMIVKYSKTLNGATYTLIRRAMNQES